MKEKSCAVFYSGGKDGHLSLLKAVNSGYKISCIINIDGGKKHKSLFNDAKKILLLKQHAKAMGFPLFIYTASSSFNPKNIKENFTKIITSALKKHEFNSVFIGITEDEIGYRALSELSKEIKVKIMMPIAKKDIFKVIEECEKLKIKPRITGVGKNVNTSWIGKIFNVKVLKYIRKERKKGNFIDGNDFQTVVIASPLFFKIKFKSKI